MADVDGDVGGTARRGPHALGDVLGGTPLLLDGGRNRRRDVADTFDGLADRLDRSDRLFGGKLHAADLAGNLLGRLGSLAGEALDLLGNHGKAAAGIAGA